MNKKSTCLKQFTPSNSQITEFLINRQQQPCSTESVNFLLQMLFNNIFPDEKTVITCQMLRKINQTHFFRCSPTLDDISHFNKLADHTFTTSWAYYKIFKDSEALFEQMSCIPETHLKIWK